MGGNTFNHAAIGFREVGVVFKEVDMPEHVGNHHFVLDGTIRFEQKAVGRISVDDNFVNLRQTEVVHRLHSLIGFTESPVRVATRAGAYEPTSYITGAGTISKLVG